jgi:hypothetical protein
MEIIADAVATDQADDEELGQTRVMSYPSSYVPRRAGGSSWRQAREQLRGEPGRSEPAAQSEVPARQEVPLEFEAQKILGAGRQGRGAWLREVSASSSSIVGRSPIRSRARARSGWCWRSSVWIRSFGRAPRQSGL